MFNLIKLTNSGWQQMASRADFVKGNLLLSFFIRLGKFQVFDMEKREFVNVEKVEDLYG